MSVLLAHEKKGGLSSNTVIPESDSDDEDPDNVKIPEHLQNSNVAGNSSAMDLDNDDDDGNNLFITI
jgi:hypothetical protein